MPRLAKDSPEARAWGEEMRAKRNAARAKAGKPAIKSSMTTNADILRSADRAFAARKKREAAEKEAEKEAERLAREEEESEKPAPPAKPAKKARKPRAKKAVEKVKEEVKERQEEEGVAPKEVSTNEVVAVEKLSIKDLRARVKAARKIACPPVGQMKLNRIIVEIMRLTHAGDHAPVENVLKMKVGEARDYLRELRRKHCPFVSKMKREDLIKEVLAVEKVAETLKDGKLSEPEDIEREVKELEFARELKAADRKIEAKKSAAASAKAKRISKKFADMNVDVEFTEEEKKAQAALDAREEKLASQMRRMSRKAQDIGRESAKDLPEYKDYMKKRRELNKDYKKFFEPIEKRTVEAAKPKKAEKVKASPEEVKEKRLAALVKAREALQAKRTGAEEAKKEALKAAMKKREEEEAAKKAAEEAAAKKKAQAAAARKAVFQGKAVKGRSIAPMRGGRRPER